MPLSRNDLKTYSSLHRKNKRLENGIFIIEGIKICQEAIQAGLEIERLFITEKTNSFFQMQKSFRIKMHKEYLIKNKTLE